MAGRGAELRELFVAAAICTMATANRPSQPTKPLNMATTETSIAGQGEQPQGRKSAFPKGRQLDADAQSQVRALLAGRPRDRDLLIEHLHVVQDAEGCLSAAHLAALAREMNLAQTEVYEVASFYHHFDVVRENQAPPPPLTVRVCDGVVCEGCGAQELIESLRQSVGQEVRVIAAPCVGACDTAPAAVVGKRQVHWATGETVRECIDSGQTSEPLPDYPNLDRYRQDGGYDVLSACIAGDRQPGGVIQELDDSGLCGMGGAGFPTARKWRFLEATPKPRALVVNADEGEPGTFKDRYCMEREPHQVLEGVLIAAWAIEADDIYIYIRDEYPASLEIFKREVVALEAAGLATPDQIKLRRGAGAYICGEEGALLESLEGKRGLPRNRPPYPAQEGLFARPTLINNIETLYWVPAILANGADWYQGEGRPRFYSVSGRVKNPGVVRAASGITARQLIDDHCGGMAEGHELSAFLPGGASGGILPADKAELPLAPSALDEFGCFVGSGAVVIFSQQDDVRGVVVNLLRFFADESCGQCTPCRVGCEKLVMMLESGNWDRDLIDELSNAMRDASICGLGQAAPNPVQAAQRFFQEAQ